MEDIARIGIRADYRELSGADRALKALEPSSKRAETATERLRRRVTQLDDGMGRALGSVRRFMSGGLTRLSSMLGTITGQFAALALGAASVFGAGAMVRTLAGFEFSMAGVAAVTRATTEELELLRDMAIDLGGRTEFSASQAAEGLRFLGMAGFTTAQSLAAIPAVLDLATAAAMDLARAADVSSNIMSAFGIAADDAGQVADVLAAASSRANTDVAQLGDAMKFAGPIASALKISINDTAAAIGVLSDAGLQGSMAGTGLRQVMSSLANVTPNARRALASLGLTVESVNPATNDLTDIVERLSGAGLDAATALTIFGDRGGPAILALVENNQKLRELTGTLSDVEGEAARMAETLRDNLKGDFDSLKAGAEALILALGDAGLTAALRSIVQGLTGMVNAFTRAVQSFESMASAGQTLLQIVLVLAATRLPLLAVALTRVSVSGGLMTAQFIAGAVASRTLTVAMGAGTVAARGLGAAMAFVGGPIGLVVGGIAAIGTVIYRTRRDMDLLRETTNNLRDAFSELSDVESTYYREQTAEALTAWAARAEAVQGMAQLALKAAEEELRRAEARDRLLWLGLRESDRTREAQAEVQRLSGDLIAVESTISAIEVISQRLAGAFDDAANGAARFSQEQLAALTEAQEMLRTQERRIELARVEQQYGRDSIAFQSTVFQQERDIFNAKLETLDVADSIKEAIRNSWDEMQRLEGASAAADAQVKLFLQTTVDSYLAVERMRDAEPKGGWLNLAIDRMATLAAAAMDAAAAVSEISEMALDDAGNPTNLPRSRPRQRPIDWMPGDGSSSRSGRGGGGRSTADQATELEKLAEAYRKLTGPIDQARTAFEALETAKELGVIGTDQHIEALGRIEAAFLSAGGTAQQWANIVNESTDSIADKLRDLGEQSLTRLGDEFINLAVEGKANFGDLAKSIIKDLLRIMWQAMVVKPFMSWLGFSDGGAFGGGGRITPFAKGGAFTNSIVDRPTPFKFAQGGGFNLGVMGEAGPEAVMPLTRGPDGSLGVQMHNDSNARQSGQPQSLRLFVTAEEGDMFRPTIRAEAEGVAVEVVQSAEPHITKKSVEITKKSMNSSKQGWGI